MIFEKKLFSVFIILLKKNNSKITYIMGFSVIVKISIMTPYNGEKKQVTLLSHIVFHF